MSASDIQTLKQKSAWVRLEVLESIARTGKGHIGGTYSCTDILVALYYAGILQFDKKNSKNPDRDRFILSKGHACLALFAIFLDLGILTKQRYDEYGINGGSLGGQLDLSIPGVEYNTGSLGHALGIACGMAIAAKLDGKKYKNYVLMGDAECYEGSVWESIMFASKHGLNNVIAIVDRNRLSVTEVLDDEEVFGDFEKKMELFGWNAYEINGHSFEEILDVFKKAKDSDRPVMIVANTIKGRGISFMENGVKWHHSVPNAKELETARKELNK